MLLERENNERETPGGGGAGRCFNVADHTYLKKEQR